MAERQFLNRFSVLRCSGFHPSGRLFGNSLRRSHHSLHTYSSKHHPTVQRAAPRRYIQSASPRHINILDSTDKDNATKQPEQGLQSTQAAPISNDEYHERSDRFFEELLEKLEDLSEQRGDVDVEYSAGVMNITFPNKGTYVLNKQPPNKQIWLSSPESGPKRYDWVIRGEGMEHKQEGEASGDWIYLRDGTSLETLIKMELGVHVNAAGREV